MRRSALDNVVQFFSGQASAIQTHHIASLWLNPSQRHN
jgi:hypothetical protein